MDIEIKFTKEDIDRVTDLVNYMENHKIVVERQHMNVERHDIDISRQKIWKTHIGCLLTSQQKSSEGSPIQRFLESASPLLSIDQCDCSGNIEELAIKELADAEGIRFYKNIGKYIVSNHKILTAGKWQELECCIKPFFDAPQFKDYERKSAYWISENLKGFGPKQSRNFLQWLGLTQYEIPIDSRVIAWFKKSGNLTTKALLSPASLTGKDYYCCILDAIQKICRDAQVLPCIFDAAVFASLE